MIRWARVTHSKIVVVVIVIVHTCLLILLLNYFLNLLTGLLLLLRHRLHLLHLLHLLLLGCRGGGSRCALTICSSLFFVGPDNIHIVPDAARIILRACNDGVALIVEGAREDFIRVAFAGVGAKCLNAVARLGGPDPACLVATRSDHFVTLGVEGDFTDLILVTLEDTCASASEDVVNSRHSVCARCCQLVTSRREAGV